MTTMTREPRQLTLRRKAADLDETAANLPAMRGKAVLRAAANALRMVADIYDLDPTLEDCPAIRERDIDLIEEIARQLWPMVRSAARGGTSWEDAEAVAARLPDLLVKARAVARTDHDTPEGSAAISRMWLIHASGYIREAGQHLREAIAKAGSLPHVTPEVAELAALADELVARAERLKAQR